MHQSADILAGDDLLEITNDIHVEHINRQVVLHAHGRSCDVHNLQALGNDILIGDILELGGSRILLWVSGIDTIHTSALEHNVGLYLYATQ